MSLQARPETSLTWRCPCGYVLTVEGPWNETTERFLEAAHLHAESCAESGASGRSG